MNNIISYAKGLCQVKLNLHKVRLNWTSENHPVQMIFGDHLVRFTEQWQIQDFPEEEGAPTPKEVPTVYLTNFPPKTAWK